MFSWAAISASLENSSAVSSSGFRYWLVRSWKIAVAPDVALKEIGSSVVTVRLMYLPCELMVKPSPL